MAGGLIIAVCGESGAGKSTTTGILADAGFAAYSLSGFLRAEAEAAFGTPTRVQVQTHGRDMQLAHGNDYYARQLVKKTDLLDQTKAVVDGMRNEDEVAYLRRAAAARAVTVLLLALVLDPDTRFQRVRGRARAGDPAERERFREDDARANGGYGGFQNNAALIAAADIKIENSGDLTALRTALNALVHGKGMENVSTPQG